MTLQVSVRLSLWTFFTAHWPTAEGAENLEKGKVDSWCFWKPSLAAGCCGIQGRLESQWVQRWEGIPPLSTETYQDIFRKAVLFCLWGVCGTGCAVTQSETFMKENDLNLDETRLHPSPLPPWCPWQPPCTCQPPRWSGSYRSGLICRGLLGPDSLIVGHDNLCQDCQIFHKQHSEIAVKCQENVIFCTWATISSTNSFFSPPTCSKPCIYELGLDFGWNGS